MDKLEHRSSSFLAVFLELVWIDQRRIKPILEIKILNQVLCKALMD